MPGVQRTAGFVALPDEMHNRISPPGRRVLCPSERPGVTSRSLHDGIQVKAVGRASRGGKRCQPHCGPLEESIGPDLIPASRVRDSNAELRKALPQVSFLDRPGLPTCLEDLVGGEGTPGVHKFASCPEGLFGRQRLLRHRLDAFGAIRQRPAQRVARPRLASTTVDVPVTIRSRHETSLSSNQTRCLLRRGASDRRRRRLCRSAEDDARPPLGGSACLGTGHCRRRTWCVGDRRARAHTLP